MRGRRCLFVMALALGASPAWAQGGSKKPPPAEITGVRFGFDGTLPAERWAPIWVDVLGGPAPFSGELVLEYSQDAVERARIVLPIATTPGETVPFELAACLPSRTTAFALTLTSGRFKQELEFIQNDRRSALPFPMIEIQPRSALIVGESSSVDAFSVNVVDVKPTEYTGVREDPSGEAPAAQVIVRGPYSSGQTPSADVWDTLAAVRTRPKDLPLGWLCYDGVDVVVAKAEELARADARARGALMTWVEAGGRLILEADGAGSAWMEFVGPGVLDIAPARLVTTGDWAGRDDQRSLSGRAIRITARGLADGWDAFWPVSGEDGVALAARGPVGTGMVTVLGVDPQRVPRMVMKESTRRLWRPLFTGEATGILPEHVRTIDPNWESMSWMSASGADSQQMAAIRSTLDHSAGIAPIGDWSFVVIAGAVLLLAACVGPFDAVILRRRGVSRWSWLSAIGWIGAASAAAYIAPMVVRSGDSVVSRTRVVDLIDDGDRRGAWSTAVASVFAGRPLSATYPSSDGAWWRGVSPVEYFRTSPTALAPVRTRLTATEPRSLSPLPLPQGQWTYRTLVQRSAGEAPPAGLPRLLVRKAGGRYAVEATGLNGAAQVRSAAMSTREGHWTLDFVTDDAKNGKPLWLADARSDMGLREVPPVWQPPRADSTSGLYWSGLTWQATGQWPSASLALPGVRERADAAAARVESGGWACVTMEIEGAEDPDMPRIENSTERSITVLRALVRIESEGRSP
ncbi:hypothetical protein PHYC_02441 [Phycisphaerales bacterium]|nr:hypothetical protein PHYC_02441 [Phycisphaerales bacterium]